jgi:hypothetical protein
MFPAFEFAKKVNKLRKKMSNAACGRYFPSFPKNNNVVPNSVFHVFRIRKEEKQQQPLKRRSSNANNSAARRAAQQPVGAPSTYALAYARVPASLDAPRECRNPPGGKRTAGKKGRDLVPWLQSLVSSSPLCAEVTCRTSAVITCD